MAIYYPDGQVILRKNYAKDANPVAQPARLVAPEQKISVSAATVHDPALFNAWLKEQTYQKYKNVDGVQVADGPLQTNAYVVQDASGADVVRHRVLVDPADPYQYQVTFFERAAIPAKSAVATPVSNSSWNASARSMDSLTGDGYFEFSVNQDLKAAYFGLTLKDTAAPGSVSPKDASYAFYLSADSGGGAPTSRIRYKAANISGVGVIPVSIAAGARYRIVRENNGLHFLVLDEDGEVLYRYDVPTSGALPGEVVLDTSMYRSNDSVLFPILITPENVEAWDERYGPAEYLRIAIEMAPLRDLWNQHLPAETPGAGVFQNRFDISFPQLSAEFTSNRAPHFDITLAPLRATFYNQPFFRIAGDLQVDAPTADLVLRTEEGAPLPQYDLDGLFEGVMYMQPLELVSALILQTAATPPPGPIVYELEVDFGSVDVDSGTPVVTERKTYLLTVSLGSVAVDTIAPTIDRLSTLVVQLGTVNVRNMPSKVRVPVTLITVDMGAVDILSEGGVERGVPTQYVVNVETGAVWTYENFDFLNPQSIDGVLFGTRGGQLHRTGPEYVDGGEPISRIRVDFGGMDFKTAITKNVDSVYAGIVRDSDASPVSVEVSTDKDDFTQVYTYNMDNVEPTSRAVIGRGLSGRTWRFSIEINEVTDFELNLFEWSVAPSTQRRRVP